MAMKGRREHRKRPDPPHAVPAALPALQVPGEFTTREKLLCAGVLLLLYTVLATWGQFDFSEFMGYYNLLADAFLDAHLYIRPKPNQGSIFDMIPYQGRYYLQWGPLPGVLHMFPKLAGWVLTDRVACLLAGWLTTLVFFAILLRLRRSYFPDVPKWVVVSFLAAFALATPTAVVTFHASIYHESIVIADLFVLLAWLAFLRYLEEPSAAWAAWAGFALCLAVTTRISLALYAVGLVVGAVALGHWRRLPRRTRLAQLAAVTMPILLGGGTMMAYNYARFGSPWEYGLKHMRNPDHRPYAWNRIPENFRHYVLAPVRFSRDLPWVVHTGWPPLVRTERAEDVSSLFLGSPFLLLGVLAWRHFRKDHPAPAPLRIFLAALCGSALLVFLSLLCFDAASRRYMHDFIPEFLILAFAGVGAAGGATPWPRWRPVAAVVLTASVLLHLHLSFFQFVGGGPDSNSMKTFLWLSPVLRRIAPGQKLEDQVAITHNDVGVMYLLQGRTADALPHFEQAAKAMPHSDRIQKNLRLARGLLGR